MSPSRILALDYGSVHTGVAISDPTGTIVRPLDSTTAAASPEGLKGIAGIVDQEEVSAVVVGLPVSLSGELGAQAQETQVFVDALREALTVPVITWDERFTSKMAAEKGRFSHSNTHSLAACCLLQDYLESGEFRHRACLEQD